MAIDTLGWFSARIVLERTVEEASGIPLLFEERILLVRATTEGEAAQRAEHFVKGRREAHSNQFGNTVVWEFKEVLDVKRLILQPQLTATA